jgi:hypothetical protein
LDEHYLVHPEISRRFQNHGFLFGSRFPTDGTRPTITQGLLQSGLIERGQPTSLQPDDSRINRARMVTPYDDLFRLLRELCPEPIGDRNRSTPG